MVHRFLRAQAQARISHIDRTKGPLVDTFNRYHDYLRISLTEKCNLRCFYCMPNEHVPTAPPSHVLSDDEVVRLASLFVKEGVTKIRLTGGEPTIRKGIVQLTGRLNHLRDLGLRTLAMTSNGLVLNRHLPGLIANGLTHLNLSLDTLDPFKFELITRRRGQSAVLRTLDAALTSPGLQVVKLNVVIIRGLNDSEIFDFVEMTKTSPLHIRFIEYMPFHNNNWEQEKMIPSQDILDRIRSKYPKIQLWEDGTNDTARRYAIPGFLGSVGFISSMSDQFCATCNRLRLTSDGQVKVCLFDAKEVSLRDLMRKGASDSELLDIIRIAVRGKQWSLGGKDNINDIDTIHNRPMVSIGGSPYPFIPSGVPRLARRSPTPMGRMLYSSSKLTHLNEHGLPTMVDVSEKPRTQRIATARGKIFLPRHAYELLETSWDLEPDPSSSSSVAQQPLPKSSTELTPSQRKAKQKGDPLITARLAAIMACKRTSDLIPLCHPIPISDVQVSFTSDAKTHANQGDCAVICLATVRCEGKTGVEMEALMAVSVGLLTVWDMLKAVAGKEMRIGEIWVTHKSGGISGDFSRS